jgi:hypothetical protein
MGMRMDGWGREGDGEMGRWSFEELLLTPEF